jgi:hypothetical protein
MDCVVENAADANVCASKGFMLAGVRTCVVCRCEDGRASMVRFSMKSGRVCVDGKTGRGVYVCASKACLTALKPSHMVRGLKVSAEVLAAFMEGGCVGLLHGMAYQKVLSLLGLARRAQCVDWGVDGAFVGDAESGFVLLASDMGERHERRKPSHANVGVFVDGEEMGRAVGAGRVIALRIRSGLLAAQAAYWWNVWYETREEADVVKTGQNGGSGSGSDVVLGYGARN